MIEFIKDALTVVGIPGALYAAWKAIYEFKNSNIEKARENRHKQAAAARDALKALFSNEKAKAAMQMLDWSGGTYHDGELNHVVKSTDFSSALRVNNLEFEPKERFIRDCFSALFDELELIEHFVEIDFLHYNDIDVPLAYYAKKIFNDFNSFSPFLITYGYPKTIDLLMRIVK